MEETTNVKVLERALSLLDAVKASEKPLGVNELAKLCSLSPATAFRLLKTLLACGWVYQDANEKYLPGHKITFVTEKNSFYWAMKETAYFIMAQLSTSEQQAMNLVVRDHEKCLILEQSRTERIVDYVPPVGTVLPVYASACGKILLSELPETLRSDILDRTEMKRLTPYTLTDRTRFLEELRVVRQRGYALDAHESQEEGFCIAVPIRAGKDSAGEIIAALSFSGFIGQKTVTEIDYYVGLLREASLKITGRLFKMSEKSENNG